ncbi:MAG TPA: VanZ family protein [Thermoanaerobaculia bacterium]
MAWSAVLLILSGRAGSGSLTSQILGWLLPASSPAFDAAHFALRKSLHVLAYGLLGFLTFRAVRGEKKGWTLRWSVTAVLLAVSIASLDEWHQSFVPGRTGTPLDVVVDCAGATLAQLFSKIADRRSQIAATHRS